MQSRDAQGQLDEHITVGQLKINMMTATDTEKETHTRAAAQTYIRTRPTITVRDPFTGEEYLPHRDLRFSSLVCLGPHEAYTDHVG